MNDSGCPLATSKILLIFSLAASAVTAPPVTRGYFSYGAFTSTENRVAGAWAITAATISGRMPLVSTFTGGPKAERAATSSGRSPARVGSPPVITMPSSHGPRAEKNLPRSAGSMGGYHSGCQASPPLWQCGQRRLQPPKKTTALMRPGQSHKESGSRPLIWFQTEFALTAVSRDGWKGQKAILADTSRPRPLKVGL